MVRTLFSAVLLLLVFTVTARAALLHEQYYLDPLANNVTVLGEEMLFGLVGEGYIDFSPWAETYGIESGSERCGSLNATSECSNYLIYSMVNFFLDANGVLLPGDQTIIPVLGAEWTIFDDWSLDVHLVFIDPNTNYITNLTLFRDAADYSVGTCTPIMVGIQTGLCSTGLGGVPVPFLNVVSHPIHVPVPATLALFGIGLAGLGWSKRNKARA